MNSFALALASIALVLVNMGIGWILAKYHSRFRPEPSEPLSPCPPVSPEMDPSIAHAKVPPEEMASSDEPAPDLSEFSMSDSDAPEALATAAPPEYYS